MLGNPCVDVPSPVKQYVAVGASGRIEVMGVEPS